MALYPVSPPPVYGYESWPEELVTRTGAREPIVQVRDVWNTTVFHARLRYDGRRDTVLAIESFYLQHRLVTFAFFDADVGYGYGLLLHRNNTGAIISTAPGGITTFALPAKLASEIVVRVNDAVVDPADYTITPGTSFDGRDKIVFGTAPTAGHSMRVDLKGNRSYNCMFLGPPRKRRLGPQRMSYDVDLIENPEERLNAT